MQGTCTAHPLGLPQARGWGPHVALARPHRGAVIPLCRSRPLHVCSGGPTGCHVLILSALDLQSPRELAVSTRGWPGPQSAPEPVPMPGPACPPQAPLCPFSAPPSRTLYCVSPCAGSVPLSPDSGRQGHSQSQCQEGRSGGFWAGPWKSSWKRRWWGQPKCEREGPCTGVGQVGENSEWSREHGSTRERNPCILADGSSCPGP